ncbi:G-protein coupled receptor Mth2 isoform X2 [Calliopsis andreniformis]|uniref:G-protein coupled receptor Mth2 isoform X2 n=1 Tax=Calliopsis andreniformis TaxID=337506 RepID=UPI003FCCDF52
MGMLNSESRKCFKTNNTFRLPPLYHSKSHKLLTKRPIPDQVKIINFNWSEEDYCEKRGQYELSPSTTPEDAFILLTNGSIYLYNLIQLVNEKYCFSINKNGSYIVRVCFPPEEDVEDQSRYAIPVGMIVSVPFLFVTFLVYSVIPDLKNMHGHTLRGYVGSLMIAYIVLASVQITPPDNISDGLCIALAIIIYFSFLASFFWLNVMCFDIWWTFGGFRSLQGSVKQRERKKFLIYSIYAWGCASLLTGVCMIMDFLPQIPNSFIRPGFGNRSCWITTRMATAIYFYAPMGVTVICNICLFISTAIKIMQHKKDTAHHLKGVDSKRHDDNKQWFNLYLKLFIVMGINWSMEIISFLFHDSPPYIWYFTDLANTLQGVIIFLIFVWKDKIKQLLLKRLGCQGRNFLSRNSTRSAYHSSASRTCTTSAAPLQEKINPYTSETLRTVKPVVDHDST